ncbi:MAG TPA: YdjY domain-containing protein [Phycisphaerales bacterium]|nr:YdjY domain-containing protein [Phycisphaerales bacterium]HRQ74799.1 YdjY domain-containing protein [Phycisphaerales bacterium]
MIASNSRVRFRKALQAALIFSGALLAVSCAERGREVIPRPEPVITESRHTDDADAIAEPIASAEPAHVEHREDERPLPARPARAVISPFDGVEVDRIDRVVRVRAWVALDAGFLEQIVCSPGTREHESLLIVNVRPSDLHAALLIAGFASGTPGRWEWNEETEQVRLIPPTGEPLDLFVQYERNGVMIEESIRDWITDFTGERTFPPDPWVFGGSMFRPNPESMGYGEYYVADISGSIVGLVTFGDEILGFSHVISDQADIHEPEWVVNTDRIPPPNTEVTLIIRRAK